MVSAAVLDGVLETMYLDYLNATAAAGSPTLTPADVGGGLVEVTRNDDVYVVRFVGLLSNRDVAQLSVDDTGLSRTDELLGGGTDTVLGSTGGVNLAETTTRLHGITAVNQNELQTLTIGGSSGTFTLSFPDATAANTTPALPFNATRADIQLALEALPEIVPGDVVLTETPEGNIQIEFTSELSSTDVPQIIAVGTGGTTAGVVTDQHGQDTGLNDMQVVTIAGVGGDVSTSKCTYRPSDIRSSPARCRMTPAPRSSAGPCSTSWPASSMG